MPEVPAIAEQGLPRYDIGGWIAMIAPAGVSKAVRESLVAQGMTPLGTTPETTAQLFKAEMERYAKIVEESGATVE